MPLIVLGKQGSIEVGNILFWLFFFFNIGVAYFEFLEFFSESFWLLMKVAFIILKLWEQDLDQFRNMEIKISISLGKKKDEK